MTYSELAVALGIDIDDHEAWNEPLLSEFISATVDAEAMHGADRDRFMYFRGVLAAIEARKWQNQIQIVRNSTE